MNPTKGASQSTNPVKFHVSSLKFESFHFDGLLLFNHIKFQLKNTEDLSLMTLKSDDTKFKG